MGMRLAGEASMDLKAWTPGIAAALLLTSVHAQTSDGVRPPRPESASNARVGGWCDALTGTKKEECLRDERRKQDRTSKGPDKRGTCDALIGPDKERCLRQGGTIEAAH
jgi:hypothetical protein